MRSFACVKVISKQDLLKNDHHNNFMHNKIINNRLDIILHLYILVRVCVNVIEFWANCYLSGCSLEIENSTGNVNDAAQS